MRQLVLVKCSSLRSVRVEERVGASSAVNRSMGRMRRSMSLLVLRPLPVTMNCMRFSFSNDCCLPRMRSLILGMVM